MLFLYSFSTYQKLIFCQPRNQSMLLPRVVFSSLHLHPCIFMRAFSCLHFHACIFMLAFSCVHFHPCIFMRAFSCVHFHACIFMRAFSCVHARPQPQQQYGLPYPKNGHPRLFFYNSSLIIKKKY